MATSFWLAEVQKTKHSVTRKAPGSQVKGAYLGPQQKIQAEAVPPLSPERANLLGAPRGAFLPTEALGGGCPAPRVPGKSLSPALCASSYFSRAVDLVKVMASRERRGLPWWLGPAGRPYRASSPAVRRAHWFILGPCWSQGRCLSPRLCSLLQVSQARAARRAVDDTLGSLGAKAATVRRD